MPARTYQINTAIGDGMEDDAGTIYTNVEGNYLVFGQWDTFYKYQFLRFINIDIPQGSTINSAVITFRSAEEVNTAGVPPDITIQAESQDNPGVLVDVANNISNRAKTTNSVAWANPSFAQSLTNYDSPDISTIIQEIVNRPGWSSGNAINIICTTDDPGADGNYNNALEYEENPSVAAILTIDFSIQSGGIEDIGKVKTKKFIHKVFDKDKVYLATWATEVINTPQFNWKVNGGMGEQIIELARPLDNYSEGTEVKMGNIIETYIQDKDQIRGRKIWEGIINNYEPLIGANKQQIVRIRAVSRMIEMGKRLVKDASSNTTVTYSSTDPSSILESLINSTAANSILKTGDIDDTDTTVTYTFKANSFVEAFEDVLRLSPLHWYWRLNPDNTVDFKKADFDEIEHQIFIGKEVSKIDATKSIENLVNRVFFMGGGDPNLFRTYERTASQSEWGLREKFIKDERVTVAASAQTISTRLLDDFDHPISQITAEVVDSNVSGFRGYDIERFKPGQIVQILHPGTENETTNWDEAYWDVDYWDYDVRFSIGQPHQIVEIGYEFNKVILRLEAKMEDVGFRLEDLKRNLKQTAIINIPSKAT